MTQSKINAFVEKHIPACVTVIVKTSKAHNLINRVESNAKTSEIRSSIPTSKEIEVPHCLELRSLLIELLLLGLQKGHFDDRHELLSAPIESPAARATIDQLAVVFAKCKQSELFENLPVVCYLSSLSETSGTESRNPAYAWASVNAYAIFELTQLQHHEHTIKLLCMRFRLAHMKKSDYTWFFERLPFPSSILNKETVQAQNSTNEDRNDLLQKIINYFDEMKIAIERELIQLKITQTTTPDLVKVTQTDKTDSVKKSITLQSIVRISEINRAFTTVLNKRPKKIIKPPVTTATNLAPPQRIPYPNDETGIKLVRIAFASTKSDGIGALEIRDDSNVRVLMDDGLRPDRAAKFSSSMQTKAMRFKIVHIKRTSFGFPTDPRILPMHYSQLIFNAFWTGFKNKNLVDSCLLLILLTGTNAEELFVLNKFRKKGKLIKDKKRKQLFWVNQLEITDSKLPKIKDLLQSQHKKFAIPLPNEFDFILETHSLITLEQIKQRIIEIKKNLKIPLLSIFRIQNILHNTLKRYTADSFMADLICGVNPTHAMSLYYCSTALLDISESYKRAITTLAAETINFQPDYLSQQYAPVFCGSQLAPKSELVAEFFNSFHDHVKAQTNPFEQFNAYTQWIWQIVLLLTAIRPVNGAPGMLNQIDQRSKLLWVSDKERRMTGSYGRTIQLCEFLATILLNYVNYMRQFSQKYSALEINTYSVIDDILHSKRPLLNQCTHKGWEEMTPQHAQHYLHNVFPLPPNWARHFCRSYLADKLPTYLIDSIMGHEQANHEVLNNFSSTSNWKITNTANAFQKMAIDLKLKKIHINV